MASFIKGLLRTTAPSETKPKEPTTMSSNNPSSSTIKDEEWDNISVAQPHSGKPPLDPGYLIRTNPRRPIDFLYAARRDRERLHRTQCEQQPQVPFPAGNPPRLPLDVALDCCNKTVAIYLYVEPKRRGTASVTWEDILKITYPKWFCAQGHQTDIEFGRFFARHFDIVRDGSGFERVTGGFHVGLCQQVHVQILSLFNELGPSGRVVDREVDPVNEARRGKYKIPPLFQALFMEIESQQRGKFDIQVKLVRTGATTGLSAAIDFGGIKGAVLRGGDAVITDLQTAIKFLMALEERERKAFPSFYTNVHNALDTSLGTAPDVVKKGYAGPAAKGSSSSWIPKPDDCAKDFEIVKATGRHPKKVEVEDLPLVVPYTKKEQILVNQEFVRAGEADVIFPDGWTDQTRLSSSFCSWSDDVPMNPRLNGM